MALQTECIFNVHFSTIILTSSESEFILQIKQLFPTAPLVCLEHNEDLSPHTNKYDQCILRTSSSIHDVYLESAFTVLKEGAAIYCVSIDESLPSLLRCQGFINPTKNYIKELQSGVTMATKPNYNLGSAVKLNINTGKQVWKMDADDLMDEDFLDDDAVLDEEDKIKPVQEKCGIVEGKKKACKNCNCGLAEEIVVEAVKVQPKIEPKSSCGSCYLGDAFRCYGCPYTGMPAFKPGEKVQL